MNFDFIYLLAALTLTSGLIYLSDRLLWAKSRKSLDKEPIWVEYSRSFFPVFLIVFLVRSFIGQIYHVPTGSLEPTVMPGDFILVTQYNYGFRVPIFNKKIISWGEPKRGDIIVFDWPVNPHVSFVKRLVGLPGDTLSYIDNVLYINGEAMPQTFLNNAEDSNGEPGRTWPVRILQENLKGLKHLIYLCNSQANCPSTTPNFYNITVPSGYYFMMGDNRDNSEDSRNWGWVPEKYISGKAKMVLFSWKNGPVWNRVGKAL